jgi:two-component system OmpR family sensor kinase
MNVSLQRRLFAWLASSILVAGLLAAGLSSLLSYRDANELQDTQLQQVAAVLSNDALSSEPVKFKPRNHEDAETHFVVKLLGTDAANADPSIDVPLPMALAPGLQTLDQSGVRWRAIVTRNAAGQRFAVAQRMTVRDEVARDAALLTLLPLVVLVPVLLLIVRIVLRRTFAPLTSMTVEVDRLDGSELTALDERGVPLETLPLVEAVNRLMRRLGRAFEQQRRLVSDAAHELRTPVATLIVQADNMLHVDLSCEAATRMRTLRQGLQRMSSMLDQLLSFARVQGAPVAAPQTLEFDTLLRTAIEESLAMAQAKQVDLGCLQIEPARIEGDPLHAYALIRNAVDNAVRYTPAGGAVDVTLCTTGYFVCLVIEDTGPGIDKADRERVFEPFVRVLGGEEPGSGLGLAISRTAAEALGGTIEISGRLDHRSGLRFVYTQAAA